VVVADEGGGVDVDGEGGGFAEAVAGDRHDGGLELGFDRLKER
jgi:hypothetical protein